MLNCSGSWYILKTMGSHFRTTLGPEALLGTSLTVKLQKAKESPRGERKGHGGGKSKRVFVNVFGIPFGSPSGHVWQNKLQR